MAIHPIAVRISGAVVGAGRARAFDPVRWPNVRAEIESALAGPEARRALDAIAILIGLLSRDGAEQTARALVAVVVQILESNAPAAPAPDDLQRFRAFAGAEMTASRLPARRDAAPVAGTVRASQLGPRRALR